MTSLSSTKDLKGVLIPTPNIIEHIKNLIETTKGFDKDVILRNIFKDYLDTKITEADFIHLINLLEYSLTANYKCLTDEEKAELTIDDIYQLIMDDYPIDYDFNEARSFKDFINYLYIRMILRLGFISFSAFDKLIICPAPTIKTFCLFALFSAITSSCVSSTFGCSEMLFSCS